MKANETQRIKKFEREKAALQELAAGNFLAQADAVSRLLTYFGRFRSVSAWHAVWLGYRDLHDEDR